MSENLSYSAKNEVANLIKRRTRLERLKIALSKAPISAWFGMVVLFIYFFAVPIQEPTFFSIIGKSLGPRTTIAMATTIKISNQPIVGMWFSLYC